MQLSDFVLPPNQLPDQIAQILQGNGKLVEFTKGSTIIHEGRLDKHTYLLLHGCVKAHLNHDGKDLAFWFGFEGDLLFSYHSKLQNRPGYESITTLEDCALWQMENDTLAQLSQQHAAISNWWQHIVEMELVKTEKRLIDRLTKPAEIRYTELLESYPSIIHRISLGTIASYLGISQVSLSRIRKKIASR